MLQSRFAEALALDERSAVATDEERAVALYRLGCYRSVTALDVKARSAPASVAVAASLAACGKAADAEMVIQGAQAQGLLRGPFQYRAVRALAPFHVGLAAELASGLTGAPGLRAAVFAAADRADEARSVVAHALRRRPAPRDRDLLLLAANFATEPAERARLLNAHLVAHGLAPVRTRAEPAAPSPMTAESTLPAGTVTGPLVSVIMPAYRCQATPSLTS